MNKLTSSLLTTIGLFAFALPYLANAENHHAGSAQFKSTPLTSNIFMLQGKGGNIGLIKGKQGLLLIDADYKEMSSALESELAKHGGINKVSYLINTHWHGDHTQGNETVGHHAQIIAHENVRPRLLTSQEIKLFNMVTEPYPEHALPSITYKTSMSLHINNKEINDTNDNKNRQKHCDSNHKYIINVSFMNFIVMDCPYLPSNISNGCNG